MIRHEAEREIVQSLVQRFRENYHEYTRANSDYNETLLSEVERLPLPLISSENLDLSYFDRQLRANNMQAVIRLTDDILLRDGLNLSASEIQMLHSIWEKLRDRRIRRK
jgi:hypothetical protein